MLVSCVASSGQWVSAGESGGDGRCRGLGQRAAEAVCYGVCIATHLQCDNWTSVYHAQCWYQHFGTTSAAGGIVVKEE